MKKLVEKRKRRIDVLVRRKNVFSTRRRF